MTELNFDTLNARDVGTGIGVPSDTAFHLDSLTVRSSMKSVPAFMAFCLTAQEPCRWRESGNFGMEGEATDGGRGYRKNCGIGDDIRSDRNVRHYHHRHHINAYQLEKGDSSMENCLLLHSLK
jgi:hypothetical protein